MSKIYVPTAYKDNCNVVYNDYIRSYTNSSNTEWVDIYFKNGYFLKQGYSNYSNNVVCDSLNTYTDDFYYRYDLCNSLIIFLILCIFIFILPLKILTRLFRRFSK